MTFRESLKCLAPKFLLRAYRDFRLRNAFSEYYGLSTKEVFEKVYTDGIWGGGSNSNEFYSGSGSHNPIIVSQYVKAVGDWLTTFSVMPNVVDLGCGDFNVGSKIRQFCAGYIACDIVPQLIICNRDKFKALNVEFKALDFLTDALPDGEIAFLRQVLQHLSNAQIAAVLPKLAIKYKYLVVTEHLPTTVGFDANLDKPMGPGIRTGIESGVVLTAQPFNLVAKQERVLCKVEEDGGVIVTILYTLK